MELAKFQILSPGGHGALLSNVANSMLFPCSDQVPDVVCLQLQVCNSNCVMLLAWTVQLSSRRCHASSITAAPVLQWAVRVLDNEELARQADASLRSGTGRTTKLTK